MYCKCVNCGNQYSVPGDSPEALQEQTAPGQHLCPSCRGHYARALSPTEA